MRLWRHPGLHAALAIGLGVVFAYASLDKIAHPRDFARIVYRYQVLGPNQALGFVPANVLAVVLPWVEALTGLLLITGLWRREAAGVAGLLLVTFLGAVGWALYQGIDIANCGCFSLSAEGRAAGWRLVLADLGLLAVAAFLTLVSPRRPQEQAVGLPAPSGGY